MSARFEEQRLMSTTAWLRTDASTMVRTSYPGANMRGVPEAKNPSCCKISILCNPSSSRVRQIGRNTGRASCIRFRSSEMVGIYLRCKTMG
jgi:hypothetical protein